MIQRHLIITASCLLLLISCCTKHAILESKENELQQRKKALIMSFLEADYIGDSNSIKHFTSFLEEDKFTAYDSLSIDQKKYLNNLLGDSAYAVTEDIANGRFEGKLEILNYSELNDEQLDRLHNHNKFKLDDYELKKENVFFITGRWAELIFVTTDNGKKLQYAFTNPTPKTMSRIELVTFNEFVKLFLGI
ncbi:hypothetical protein LY02_00453 [Nonlabens ulvanivorans]|uniref:DUF4252 domain-containing protein n=2 Tax=Nonlabens ulvanivorans TaxID=906888 RepID=A0ABX5E7Q6_NONUL|nr:hypothetical protein LY02_00453 [Nonlabens ulvanivorans]